MHVVTEGPDWPAIVGVAGTLAGGLLAAWLTDRRRSTLGRAGDQRQFKHDRELKSAHDLVAHVDDVQSSLEDLCEACAAMRFVTVTTGYDREHPAGLLAKAEDAHQRTRRKIARLTIPPHGGSDLVEMATAAGDAYSDAIKAVRGALLGRPLGARQARGSRMAITSVPRKVDRGIKATRDYEAAALSTDSRDTTRIT